jgi:tRNA 5-methylaminomethyl-2-thiouridine biosynthesis bifunctional protein
MPIVSWDGDGMPRSPLYQDIYRSRNADGDQGLAQARHVFLDGCQLLGPQALWQDQPHWCVLENGFGLGLNFLATWLAWRADARRPGRLHYIATEAHPVQADDLLRSSSPWPELLEVTQQLARQWWGLLPGMHRLSFESGALVLDLVVGDCRLALPQLDVQAHSVYLDGFAPDRNPQMWQPEVLQQLHRLSRPRARWSTWCVNSTLQQPLTALGLHLEKRPGLAPKRECLSATCGDAPLTADPPHILASGACHASSAQQPVVVLGAGLAGAHVARALAQLGRSVRIVDAQGPAAGASGLPAGIFAAHTSGDDQDLTRLTRMGLRHTLTQLAELTEGEDWALSGLDEHLRGVRAQRKIPQDPALRKGWSTALDDLSVWRSHWWQALDDGWHQPKAGWIKPRPWIDHLLDHPLIETAWGWRVQSLQAQACGWCIQDERQRLMSGLSQVVVALGPDSMPLLHGCGLPMTMQPVRGQVSWGPVPIPQPARWPSIPRNGDGSLLPHIPMQGVDHWVVGSSFDRSSDRPTVTLEDQRQNALRWQSLAPEAAERMPDFEQCKAWAGVRATVRDRLPRVGPASEQTPGLWVMTGLGARGLTVSSLSAEQLAAWMTQTSSPLPLRLGRKIHHLRD